MKNSFEFNFLLFKICCNWVEFRVGTVTWQLKFKSYVSIYVGRASEWCTHTQKKNIALSTRDCKVEFSQCHSCP